MSTEYTLFGNGAATGIVIGPALLYRPYRTMSYGFRAVQAHSRYRDSGTANEEMRRLDEAIAAVDASLTETATRLRAEKKSAEAHIFEDHRTLLNNPALRERALTLINKASWRASEAIVEAGEQHAAPLSDTGDPYLSAHAADIRDVVSQVRRFLVKDMTLADMLTQPAIVVAEDLGLSEWMNVRREYLLGLVLAGGGLTSHSTIMARSLGIPTIIGLGTKVMRHVHDGMLLALDGGSGRMVVQPDDSTVAQMRACADELAEQQLVLRSQRDLPSVTSDGHAVVLLANAATVIEAQTAREWGAQGIGSLRTEMLFLGRSTLPNEDEQIALYKAVAAELPGCPVAARTLDIGGDKYLPSFPLPGETNPFLGWRGIRIGLSEPETILLPQLRAMLRAGAEAPIQIVLPMIATMSELRQVRALVQQAHHNLVTAGIPCIAKPKIGVMIEIPSAAILADSFARECDFLSIGTNDLIQYTLACDRTNQRVAHIYQQLEPSVLQLIQASVDAAHRYGLKISVCGEMASDPAMTPLLVGMGVDELSCTPMALPLVRAALREAHMGIAREMAQAVRSATCLGEVQEILQRYGSCAGREDGG
jgi:phosphotransferase system enzyme I (PtsI)